MPHNYIEKAYPSHPKMIVTLIEREIGKPRIKSAPILDEKSPEEIAELHRKCKVRSRMKLEDNIRSHVWDWFLTFSFSTQAVADRKDYDECLRKATKALDNLKQRKAPTMVYVLRGEMHPSSGAWHFHALITDADGLTFVPAWKHEKGGKLKRDQEGNRIRVKDSQGRPAFNLKDWKMGHTLATIVESPDAAERYIAKYITKCDDIPRGRQRYSASKKCNLSSVTRLMLTEDEKTERLHKLQKTHETVWAKTVSLEQGNYQNSMMICILQAKPKEVEVLADV